MTETTTAVRLRVAGVSKSFDDGARRRRVLDDVSFCVSAGEAVVLWGPSGSGKTTLLNVIGGLIRADAGSIELVTPTGPLDVATLSDAARRELRRRSIGFVFQFFNLVPTLTVAENVRLPLELAGRDDLDGRALERLSDLGVAHVADRFPETLSGGEQQRVAIARALAHEPVLVLADEPTGNLDAATSELVVDLLFREVARLGCALVVATHSAAIADRCDRVVAL